MAIASLKSGEVGVVHNTSKNFKSEVRAAMNITKGGMPASVRPDAIMKRFGVSVEVSLKPKGEVYLSPHFFEAKATSASITKRYRKGQITGMVDAVADLKKKRGERATLTLITTSNTKISKSIREYAAKRGVYLNQSIAAIDDETGDFVISNPVWVNNEQMNDPKKENMDAAGWLISKVLEIIINKDPYDKYDPVKPKEYTKNITEPGRATDPDPATIED